MVQAMKLLIMHSPLVYTYILNNDFSEYARYQKLEFVFGKS
jgi:hypothetical protein